MYDPLLRSHRLIPKLHVITTVLAQRLLQRAVRLVRIVICSLDKLNIVTFMMKLTISCEFFTVNLLIANQSLEEKLKDPLQGCFRLELIN